MVEHGATQGAECRRLALAAGFARVETFCDLAGLERVTTGVVQTNSVGLPSASGLGLRWGVVPPCGGGR